MFNTIKLPEQFYYPMYPRPYTEKSVYRRGQFQYMDMDSKMDKILYRGRYCFYNENYVTDSYILDTDEVTIHEVRNKNVYSKI